MKINFFALIVLLCFSLTVNFAQDSKERINIGAVARHFLNSIASQSSVPSDLIATESLDKAKELSLSMALRYDSTGASNSMMQLPANKIKSMTSAELWDYMNKISGNMKKLDLDIDWTIINTEIKNDVAFVTYDVKNRLQKVMQLKKENNQWKVVLSFDSIF